jgi:hypothetical protein
LSKEGPPRTRSGPSPAIHVSRELLWASLLEVGRLVSVFSYAGHLGRPTGVVQEALLHATLWSPWVPLIQRNKSNVMRSHRFVSVMRIW